MAEYEISEMLDSLDALDVAYSLGIETKRVGSKTSILCPAHEDTHFGSCFLYRTGFHCFACGAHGSLIDLVALYKGIKKNEAVDELAAMTGSPERFRKKGSKQVQIRKTQKSLPEDVLKLIGLTNKSEKRIVGIRSTFEKNLPLKKGQTLRWEISDEDDSEGYYLVEEKVFKSPLEELLEEDPAAFRDLIREKSRNALAYHMTVLSELEGRCGEAYELFQVFSAKDIEEEIAETKKNIEAIRSFMKEHGIPTFEGVFGKLSL